MLHKFTEQDFVVLRGPFESGRQSPKVLGGILIFSILLQGLMFFLTYIVIADSSIYPNQETMFYIHLAITAFIIVLSILYGIPNIYGKGQKMQYVAGILVIQNIATLCLINSLFIFSSDLVNGC